MKRSTIREVREVLFDYLKNYEGEPITLEFSNEILREILFDKKFSGDYFFDNYNNYNLLKKGDVLFSINNNYSKNKIDMLQNNRVEMDSSEFEKHFNVYSENKIVAMQVLTSDVMMILLEFYNKYKIDYEILLRDKKIYLRFFVGPIFEPPIFKNSMDKKLLLQHYKNSHISIKM